MLKCRRNLASQSIPSWNQIIDWLKEMEILRKSHIILETARDQGPALRLHLSRS